MIDSILRLNDSTHIFIPILHPTWSSHFAYLQFIVVTWILFQYFTTLKISEPRRKNEDTEEAQKRRKQRAKKRKQQMQKKIEENKVNGKRCLFLRKLFIIHSYF